ncbi:MAG: ABC transporter permease [Chloroflexi bacterium]|nr:ABC transporter permease [Chloroflexota bacterium]
MSTAAPAQPPVTISNRDRTINLLTQIWSWLFLIGLIAFFSFAGEGFFSIRNFGNILVSGTLIILMALGQTFVIITGGIDLSIGWTVGLSSVVTARVMRDLSDGGVEVIPAILIGVVFGLLVALIPGIVNGILIARIRIPPFIATLGMFGIVRGAAFLLTDGQNVIGNIDSSVRDVLRLVGNGSLLYNIPDFGIAWLSQPPDLTREQLRALQRLAPYPVLIVAVIIVIMAFVLARTQFGRHTYAIGGNAEAARRAGINVSRHLITIYIISALMAGIAGVLHVFRFTAGAPQAGESALLDSVAAVVIGGTSLFGGEGRISGSVVGALIIAVLGTGLVILNIDALWQFVIVGCIIIVAVLVNQVQSYLENRQAHHE